MAAVSKAFVHKPLRPAPEDDAPITREHVLMALREIDPNNIPPRRRSTGYDLVFEGRHYPPKYVLGVANRFANGCELEAGAFHGGKGSGNANAVLEVLGFTIVARKP